MGFLKTGTTDQMQVYITEYGKTQILQQSFLPMYFTINDSDVNYLTNQVMNKEVVDISGDYDDNIFSLSRLRNIKTSIIQNINTGTPTGGVATTTASA
jgi:hypothetical protein